MSSVGSLSTSTSTSIRGYGGLASGLDRDELIEGMTIGTTTKINKQEQKKQQIQWMQEAVQTISDKMISFHGKYTETLTSPTNLFSGALWGRNKINVNGINAKKVSVSGTSLSGKGVTVMGVKQLAQKATLTTNKADFSDGKFESGEIKDTITNAKYERDNLAGQTLKFKYDDTEYSVTFSELDNYRYDSTENLAKAFNENFLKDLSKDGKKLSEFIEAKANDDGSFSLATKNGKSIDITGGSAVDTLGFSTTTGQDAVTSKTLTKSDLVNENVNFAEYVSGKSLTFSYNGKTATVKMPGADQLENKTSEKQVEAIAEELQKQFDQTFGEGRIKVDGKDGKLSFKTAVPGKDEIDKTSVLTLTGGDAALVGGTRGALKSVLKVGDSTKTNIDAKIATPGSFTINGKTVSYGGEGQPQTLNELITKINNDNLGFKISFSKDADKFTITSTDTGADETLKIDKNSATTLGTLFGFDFSKLTADANGAYTVRGEDAVFSVRYSDSNETVELRRDSNTFDVDGLSIELKGRFGYNGDALEVDKYNDIDESNAVEITATADVDKLVDTIKSFVEEYNAIVDMVNTEVSTKHEKDYTPLSSEQKSELSDDEIEKWETKAKTGLLYGDSDLRSLSMDLRTVATSYVWQLEQVGISVSGTYSDNGKLSVDETKLRAALEKDPGSVEKLFTAQAGTDENGKPIYDGVATNLKRVMEKYVKTTGDMDHKGILVRKAGSKSSAVSMTDNYYYNQLKDIDKLIDTLNDRLKTERDRYIKQFTTLESVIANMNSQSSYLSSMSGY